MARINRQEPLKEMQDGLRLDTAREKTPLEVADKVLPVFKINPKPLMQIAQAQSNDTTNVAIFTTSAVKRTFLTYVMASYTKDVINTSIQTFVTAFPVGQASIRIISMRYEPLTANNESIILQLNPPLELERSTAVTILNTNGLASIDMEGIAGFFEVEN